jgi:hypothetical protein
VKVENARWAQPGEQQPAQPPAQQQSQPQSADESLVEPCPVSLRQQFKSINSRIGNVRRGAPALRLSFQDDGWKKKEELEMGDSSMSGDEEDNGWKALRYDTRTHHLRLHVNFYADVRITFNEQTVATDGRPSGVVRAGAADSAAGWRGEVDLHLFGHRVPERFSWPTRDRQERAGTVSIPPPPALFPLTSFFRLFLPTGSSALLGLEQASTWPTPTREAKLPPIRTRGKREREREARKVARCTWHAPWACVRQGV